jgi:hypothetical protein
MMTTALSAGDPLGHGRSMCRPSCASPSRLTATFLLTRSHRAISATTILAARLSLAVVAVAFGAQGLDFTAKQAFAAEQCLIPVDRHRGGRTFPVIE